VQRSFEPLACLQGTHSENTAVQITERLHSY